MIVVDRKTRQIIAHTEIKPENMQRAQEQNLKAFQIFSDAVLDALVLHMPQSSEEACRIKGIGERKAQTILPEFLELIRQYREENL